MSNRTEDMKTYMKVFYESLNLEQAIISDLLEDSWMRTDVLTKVDELKELRNELRKIESQWHRAGSNEASE